MHKFFFNSEVLPSFDNIHKFVQLFSNTLIEYNQLTNNTALKVDKGIVTEQMPSTISFGNFSLQEVIEKIEDRKLKIVAYSYFIKHPIAEHFTIDREEDFMEKDYYAIVGEQEYEALYAAYIADLKGFLFTVAVHKDLKQNQLTLLPRDNSTPLKVNNLFGQGIEELGNNEYIKTQIEQLNKEGLSVFERLGVELGNPIYSSSFEREFAKLSLHEQQSIVDEIEKAKGRGLTTPLYPDTKIVKDVTPSNAQYKVCELRVYTPTALRVYFSESKDKVYVASVEKKSNADQNKDIKKAANNIRKLILTN